MKPIMNPVNFLETRGDRYYVKEYQGVRYDLGDHTVRRREMSDGARLYYSPPEYQILLNSAPKRRTYFATRLEAECSPRIGLVSQIERGDFFIPLDPDVELVFLKIRDGKDTTDGRFRRRRYPLSGSTSRILSTHRENDRRGGLCL
jgi:hypothetical protein